MIKIRHIRTKLLLLLFASALLCLGLFHTLWANKWYVLHLVTETNLPISLPIPQLDENFWTMLGTEALNYDIPDSEADTEAVKNYSHCLISWMITPVSLSTVWKTVSTAPANIHAVWIKNSFSPSLISDIV